MTIFSFIHFHLSCFRSFLSNLPDKGAKLNKQLLTLKQELERRQENKQNCVKNSVKEPGVQQCSSDKIICDRLEEQLERLQVESDGDNEPKGRKDSTQHQFEIAVQRAQQNVFAGKKEPVMLNRFGFIINLEGSFN